MSLSAKSPPWTLTSAARAAFCLLGAILLAVPSRAGVVPVWPEDLAAHRRELLTKALAFLKAHPAVPYLEGGASDAGMDCSGATTVMLKQVGIMPPRSAHGQYEWLKESFPISGHSPASAGRSKRETQGPPTKVSAPPDDPLPGPPGCAWMER